MLNFFKKGIGPIVSVSLIILVTIFAFISLQIWYGDFLFSQFSNYEEEK